MGVSNMTLVKIAALGGIATITMGLALRGKINNEIKQTEYYKEALKTLRSNKAAVHLLGEPIRAGTIDVGDSTKNFTKETAAQYEVPVRGPKLKGTMYFWASNSRQDADSNKWTVDRIELGLQNEPNRRLLIKK